MGLVHVQGCHLPTYARLSEEKYQLVCTELMIREDFPDQHELDGGCAISGLDVYTKALVCGVEGCLKLFASGDLIRKHYDKEYGVEGAQVPSQFNVTYAQHLDQNHHKSFFRVISFSQQPVPVMNND